MLVKVLIYILLPVVLYGFFVNLAIRDIIFSILIGSVPQKEKQASRIARVQPLKMRWNMTYVEAYVSQYRRDYRFYMRFKRAYCIWWMTSLFFIVIDIFVFSEWNLGVIIVCKVFIETICLLLPLIISRSGPDKKTKYDRH